MPGTLVDRLAGEGDRPPGPSQGTYTRNELCC